MAGGHWGGATFEEIMAQISPTLVKTFINHRLKKLNEHLPQETQRLLLSYIVIKMPQTTYKEKGLDQKKSNNREFCRKQK